MERDPIPWWIILVLPTLGIGLGGFLLLGGLSLIYLGIP